MFAPLLRVLRAIFVDDLRVHRDTRGLRLGLQRKTEAAVATKATMSSKDQAAANAELARIMRDLEILFESIPGSRRALCHLAYVEHEIGEQGVARLDTLPLNLLRQGLAELENAVVNWSPAGLATLRSKMAVALRQREAAGTDDAIDVPLSRANLPAPEVFEGGDNPACGDGDEAALLAAYAQVASTPERA